MDSRPGLLNGGAVRDVVKSENKKFTIKIKKAAPKPTEAGNWKESDAKSRSQPSYHCCTGMEQGLNNSRCRQQALCRWLARREPSR